MKIVAYGDVHIHPFNEFSRMTDSGLTNRVEIALQSLRWVFDYAKANNVDRLINMGDLFESPKMINTEIASALVEVLGEYNFKYHDFIMGNHDIMDWGHKYNVAKVFSKYYNIIDANNYQDKGRFDCGFVYLPYLHNCYPAIDWLKSLPKEGKEGTYVFGHWSIDGVKYTEDYPVSTNALQSLFDDFELSTFGHIHLRQILGAEKKIVYPGSLLTHSFKSAKGGKGAILIDTQLKTWEFLDNPYSPKFEILEIRKKEDLEKPITEFTRIRVVKDLLPYLEKRLEELNLKVSVSTINEVQLSNRTIKVDSTWSDSQIVSAYIKDNEMKKSSNRYTNSLLRSVK